VRSPGNRETAAPRHPPARGRAYSVGAPRLTSEEEAEAPPRLGDAAPAHGKVPTSWSVPAEAVASSTPSTPPAPRPRPDSRSSESLWRPHAKDSRPLPPSPAFPSPP